MMNKILKNTKAFSPLPYFLFSFFLLSIVSKLMVIVSSFLILSISSNSSLINTFFLFLLYRWYLLFHLYALVLLHCYFSLYHLIYGIIFRQFSKFKSEKKHIFLCFLFFIKSITISTAFT